MDKANQGMEKVQFFVQNYRYDIVLNEEYLPKIHLWYIYMYIVYTNLNCVFLRSCCNYAYLLSCMSEDGLSCVKLT